MVSQGVPMVYMGDEYGHSKKGNNNTWCQDSAINWFLWDQLEAKAPFFHFYKSLIHFRKNHSLFRQDHFLKDSNITWHGTTPFQPEWEKDNFFIAFTLNEPGEGPSLYIAFNADHHPQWLHLPPPREGSEWRVVVDTHGQPPEDFFEEGNRASVSENKYYIFSRSAILLEC